MAKDRLLFMLSFAFIGIIAALLFSRHPAPPPPPPAPEQATTKVEEKQPEKPIISEPLPLESGKLAVPFQLTSRSSIVQFLKTGSLVNVIFTSDADNGFGTITLNLLDNVRVLDIGRNAEGKAFNEIGASRSNTPVEILLELTPRQAEILSYAEQAGTLTLDIEGHPPIEQPNPLLEDLLKSDSSDSFQSILATYMMNTLFPGKSNVKIITTSKGYIVTGKVKDQQTSERIIQILSMFTKNSDKGVINLIEKLPEAPQVLVATKDLKANAPLQVSDYQWVEINPNELNPSLVVRSQQTEKWVNDYILSKDVPQGTRITRNDIIWKEDLNNLLQPHKPEMLPLAPCKVAIPFELNPESSLLPFLQLGLRVDVRFISAPEVGLSPVNLVLLKNIRILSINKPIEVKNLRISPPSKPSPTPFPTHPPIELVLEMTPRQAEIFSFAQRSGLIFLELTDCQMCDDSRELMEITRPSNYEDLVELLWGSESYEDFRSILVTYMIRSIFPNVCLKVTLTPRGVIVEGKVPDPQMAQKVMEILVKLVPGADRALINLLDVEPQQVMISVKVYEVTKDILSRIGVNWSVLYDSGKQALGLSSVFPVEPPPNYFLTARGTFGNYQLTALLDMLEHDNWAKLLAAPKLTTVSGQTAHFFSGGEFPILIPQGTGLLGLTTVTVLYKKYGVLLDFTPEVDLNGSITLHVVPEVSVLDKENAVIISGFLIPALLTRRADTKVKLWPGQSYIIAGLYLDQQLNRNTNLYGLNKLPFIGALFNSNRYEQRKQELMIIVTPHLIYNPESRGRAVNDYASCEDACPEIPNQAIPPECTQTMEWENHDSCLETVSECR